MRRAYVYKYTQAKYTDVYPSANVDEHKKKLLSYFHDLDLSELSNLSEVNRWSSFVVNLI